MKKEYQKAEVKVYNLEIELALCKSGEFDVETSSDPIDETVTVG